MKKGFTMIELIFVIVILGILAAVAIPRLTATRDDAEVAKAATNVTTLINDISGYYTSQGTFGTLSQMSNVVVDTPTNLTIGANGAVSGTATGSLVAAGKKCLKFTLTPEVNTDAKRTPAYFTLASGEEAASPICVKIIKDPEVNKYATMKFKGQTYDTTEKKWEPDSAETTGMQITGLSVVR